MYKFASVGLTVALGVASVAQSVPAEATVRQCRKWPSRRRSRRAVRLCASVLRAVLL